MKQWKLFFQLVVVQLLASLESSGSVPGILRKYLVILPRIRGQVDCSQNGWVPSPEDCHSFFLCRRGRAYPFFCPLASTFHPVLSSCIWGPNPYCGKDDHYKSVENGLEEKHYTAISPTKIPRGSHYSGDSEIHYLTQQSKKVTTPKPRDYKTEETKPFIRNGNGFNLTPQLRDKIVKDVREKMRQPRLPHHYYHHSTNMYKKTTPLPSYNYPSVLPTAQKTQLRQHHGSVKTSYNLQPSNFSQIPKPSPTYGNTRNHSKVYGSPYTANSHRHTPDGLFNNSLGPKNYSSVTRRKPYHHELYQKANSTYPPRKSFSAPHKTSTNFGENRKDATLDMVSIANLNDNKSRGDFIEGNKISRKLSGQDIYKSEESYNEEIYTTTAYLRPDYLASTEPSYSISYSSHNPVVHNVLKSIEDSGNFDPLYKLHGAHGNNLQRPNVKNDNGYQKIPQLAFNSYGGKVNLSNYQTTSTTMTTTQYEAYEYPFLTTKDPKYDQNIISSQYGNFAEDEDFEEHPSPKKSYSQDSSPYTSSHPENGYINNRKYEEEKYTEPASEETDDGLTAESPYSGDLIKEDLKLLNQPGANSSGHIISLTSTGFYSGKTEASDPAYPHSRNAHEELGSSSELVPKISPYPITENKLSNSQTYVEQTTYNYPRTEELDYSSDSLHPAKSTNADSQSQINLPLRARDFDEKESSGSRVSTTTAAGQHDTTPYTTAPTNLVSSTPQLSTQITTYGQTTKENFPSDLTTKYPTTITSTLSQETTEEFPHARSATSLAASPETTSPTYVASTSSNFPQTPTDTPIHFTTTSSYSPIMSKQQSSTYGQTQITTTSIPQTTSSYASVTSTTSLMPSGPSFRSADLQTGTTYSPTTSAERLQSTISYVAGTTSSYQNQGALHFNVAETTTPALKVEKTIVYSLPNPETTTISSPYFGSETQNQSSIHVPSGTTKAEQSPEARAVESQEIAVVVEETTAYVPTGTGKSSTYASTMGTTSPYSSTIATTPKSSTLYASTETPEVPRTEDSAPQSYSSTGTTTTAETVTMGENDHTKMTSYSPTISTTYSSTKIPTTYTPKLPTTFMPRVTTTYRPRITTTYSPKVPTTRRTKVPIA